jgi:hypothetical protein
MSILDFRDDLLGFGLPLLDAPSETYPPIQEHVAFITLCMQLPENQSESLLAADGIDPTDTRDALPPVQGAESRRILSRLKRAEHIMAWHAFKDNGICYVHVQLSRNQAEMWYSMIDWVNKTNGEPQKTELHTF